MVLMIVIRGLVICAELACGRRNEAVTRNLPWLPEKEMLTDVAVGAVSCF